jgi:hypothetical protein
MTNADVHEDLPFQRDGQRCDAGIQREFKLADEANLMHDEPEGEAAMGGRGGIGRDAEI